MVSAIEKSVKIQNITGTFAFESPIDLEAVYSKYDERLKSKLASAVYKYGGIVLWVHRPKITFLIYRNGNVIFAGCKDIEDIRESLDLLLSY